MTVPQHHRVHRSSVSFTLETPEESTKSEEQHGQAASYYPSGLAIDTIFPGPDMVGIDRFIKDGVIGIPGCPPRHLRSGAGCFSSDPTRQDIDPITGTIIQRGFPSNPCAPARWRSQGWELDCKQSLPDLVEELAELAKIVDRPLVSPRRRRVDALRTHRPRRATAPIRVPVQKGNRG